jgi:DNA-binding MarR family transcriptional regulator
MLSVLPHAFKQMMVECKDRIPEELSDIGEAQFWLLFLLAEEDLTMSELARRMQVTPPTVSRMVDSLAGKGLVERRQDTEDRRITWLSLSDRGSEVNRELDRVFQGAVTEFMRPLDEAQLRSVVLAMDVLQGLLRREHGALSSRENT